MKQDWFNLSWLPSAPPDFSDKCRTAKDGATLRSLASFRLSDTQLNRLAKQSAIISSTPNGFESFRLAIIGNANSDFLVSALKASGLRYGVWLDVFATHVGQTATAVLDPHAEIYEFKPDAVLLALTSHVLPVAGIAGAEASAALDNLKAEVSLIRDTLAQRGISLIVQTMPHAPLNLFGSLDRRVEGTLRHTIDRFNTWLWQSGLYVIDIAALAELTGLASWHDSGQWHWAKLPFAQNLIPVYADYIARYIGALRGRSRKALVLDLDNTLWGGVIGDDGLEGIELGQGSPRGEAFLAVQRMAFALRARGVILAVCSKNDEKNARLPFDQHPDQILKGEHIAVFQANWSDKASNLDAIAKALEITPDALVFLDDNPAEREIVRRELPAVAVPEIPGDDPSLWPQILAAAGYFESVSFTDADRDRADQYTANTKRESLKVESRDIGEYLKALGMTLEISAFTPGVRERVAQLINRSNQFNLTTRRYTEDQLARMSSEPNVNCFCARLRDRFGDNGIISVVICRDDGDAWYIDTWLMSCRVLGREVERSMLNYIAASAKAAGKTGLKGHYIPTPKNGMVAEHYTKLGFKQETADNSDGDTFWHLDLRSYSPGPVPLDIKTIAA